MVTLSIELATRYGCIMEEMAALLFNAHKLMEEAPDLNSAADEIETTIKRLEMLNEELEGMRPKIENCAAMSPFRHLHS